LKSSEQKIRRRKTSKPTSPKKTLNKISFSQPVIYFQILILKYFTSIFFIYIYFLVGGEERGVQFKCVCSSCFPKVCLGLLQTVSETLWQIFGLAGFGKLLKKGNPGGDFCTILL
jgi:hypothetical protein